MNRTITLRFMLFFALFLVSAIGMAATITTTGNGNWGSTTSAAPWPGGTIPATGDDIVVGNNLTLIVDSNRTCNSITLGTNSVLVVNSGVVLTVTTAVNLYYATGGNYSAEITGNGTLNAATLEVGSTEPSYPGNSAYTQTLSLSLNAINLSGTATISSYSGNGGRRINGELDILSGVLTVNGSVVTSNEGGSNVSVLSLANSPQTGTLKLGNATPFSLSGTGSNTITLTGSNTTVEYSLTGAQAVYATTYNNLTLSGSGTKTFSATTTINNNLDIKTGAAAALGTGLTHPAKVLLFNGIQQVAGQWGYSGATNNNTTYFTNTTGRVNVSGRYYSNGGAPNLVTSWTLNRNNTGSNPANFTTANQEFYVQNGNSITTSAAWNITGANTRVVIENGGTMTSSSAITIPLTGTFQVDNGGTYIHNNTGTASSTIFQGTEVFGTSSNVRIDNWTNTSTVIITGVSLPFGNLEINWNGGATWSQAMTGAIDLTAGNFTITNYGTSEIRLTSASSGTALTLGIGGNLSVASGILTLVGGGTASTKACTVNVGGNLSITNAGIIDMNLNQATSGAVAINVEGNFLVSGTALLRNSLGSGTRTVTFNNASANQTFTSTTGGINTNAIAFVVGTGTSTNTLQLLTNFVMNNTGSLTVSNNASLNTGTNIVQATTANTAGNFTLSSGGTLLIGSTAGITSSGTASGNIQTSTTRSFSTVANYTYNGTTGAQAAGTGLPATVSNLWITNTAGVTLASAKTITNNLLVASGATLDLGSGLIHTTGSLTLAGVAQSTSTSYGGTGSPAANTSALFANNTGVVNVGTCGTYSLSSTANTSTCHGTTATVSVTASAANLPVGTYTVYYTLTGVNTGSGSASMSVATAGSGSFVTSSLTNSGATTITINYLTNGCVSRTATNNTATITVNPDNTAGSPSSTPTLCINTAISPNITIATTIATGIGTATGLPTGVNASWSANTITISGTPSVSGTFNYSIPLTGGCGPTVNATGTINVTAANTAGLPSSTPALCVNTALTSITHSTTGATGIGTATGLPSGVTAGWASNTITISGTPTASGIFNYTIPLTGGCGSINATGTITVNAGSSSAVISGSASICSGTSTNLQVAITGGTSPYTLVYSGGTIPSYISNAAISVSPSSTTNYTITSVTDANGCVGTGNSGTATVTITTTTSTDGGATWNNGTPSNVKAVVFDGSTGTISSDISGCSLRLTNNATVTVASAIDVTLSGAITVDSGSTFTLNNNANLLQSGTTNSNSGNIVVKRNSSALKRLDYTLWSSPVAGQGVYSFSPFTFGNRFYVYRPTTNLYNNADVGFNLTGLNSDGVNGTDSNNVQFAQAKGYLIRMPWDHPTAATVWNGTFTGVPNNGDITFTMTNGGVGQRFNLLGNPYPSPISMTQFVSDNSAKITGTLYFWRETNGTTANNAYCSWAGGTFTSNGQAQVVDPSGIIRTGQGFIVEALGASTTVDFKNGQRSSDNSNQFFKTNNVANNVAETNRFWLNLTNTSGAFSQMAAGYMTNATDGVDLYDGKNINTGNVLLNSILDSTDYTIQGKALPFNMADVVPLSYKVTDAGQYSITIDHVDGLFSGGSQPIYLKDNLTSTEHDLQTGAYTFTSASGSFNDRFEIIYQSQLAVDNPIFNANNVVIYNQNNDLIVNSGNIIMKSIKVFDIRGRLLQNLTNVNATQTVINGSSMANAVLLVQITSEDGAVVTKKVIK